jgi:cell division protein ZapA
MLMSVQITGTTVSVLGKTYQLKCAEHETQSIQKAAEYLESKMQEVREVTHLLSVDRIAVLAALSITHQLLALEGEKNNALHLMNERLRELQNKIDKVFPPSQMELSSVECS